MAGFALLFTVQRISEFAGVRRLVSRSALRKLVDGNGIRVCQQPAQVRNGNAKVDVLGIALHHGLRNADHFAELVEDWTTRGPWRDRRRDLQVGHALVLADAADEPVRNRLLETFWI